MCAINTNISAMVNFVTVEIIYLIFISDQCLQNKTHLFQCDLGTCEIFTVHQVLLSSVYLFLSVNFLQVFGLVSRVKLNIDTGNIQVQDTTFVFLKISNFADFNIQPGSYMYR